MKKGPEPFRSIGLRDAGANGQSAPDRARLLEMASQSASEGNFREALRLTDRVRRDGPTNELLARLCARLLQRMNRASEGLAVLSRVTTTFESPTSALSLAELLLDLGDAAGAADIVETLLAAFALDFVPGLAEFANRLCATPGADKDGWIGFDSDGSLQGTLSTDRIAVLSPETSANQPTIATDHAGTNFRLPPPLPSGRLPRDIRVLGSRSIRWPAPWRLEAWVERDGNILAGGATMRWSPVTPVVVVVSDGDGHSLTQPTEIAIDPSGEPGQRFTVALPAHWETRDLQVEAITPDGDHVPILKSFAKRADGSSVDSPPDSSIGILGSVAPTERIAVIVPVYAGLEDTLHCLNAVLSTIVISSAELIVVDDASPDPGLSKALDLLAESGRITLLRNARNLGFPGAVNRGMALRPTADVVLLNADAEVFGDWLERLSEAAYAAPEIATVTPFANNGSIMAYPSGESAEICTVTAADIDTLCREADFPSVDLPTGVGFCMFIKRACVSQVGAFDDHSFGLGYGEENDFCLRASRSGWRHVGAPNVFVRHIGGRSFGRLKPILMRHNLRILNRLHPGYTAQIERFVTVDPLHAARRAMDAVLLAADHEPSIVLITLGREGGVERHVRDRSITLRAAGYRVIQIKPASEELADGLCRLSVARKPLYDLVYRLPAESEAMVDLLRSCGVARVEIHHFLGLDQSVLDLPRRLGVPYEVFIHDYAWICPRITLVTGDERYCGQPPLAECERCIAQYGSLIEEKISVTNLRARSERVLRGAASVSVPCADVAARLRPYFPHIAPTVTPWEPIVEADRETTRRNRDRIRVAMIGAIGAHKGYHFLLACALDAARRDLPLDFVVIGYSEDDSRLFATGHVFTTGRYEEGEIMALIAREACDAALFPGVAPETWSYSLTHVLRAGLPILAHDFGAIGERLQNVEQAHLAPPATPAHVLNNMLLAICSVPLLQIDVRLSDGRVVNMSPGEQVVCPAGESWIEDFRINYVKGSQKLLVRYKGMVAGGAWTAWTEPGSWCQSTTSTRPLFGLSIVQRGGPKGLLYCGYAATFFSGIKVGGLANGEECRSPIANDPLVGLRVTLPRML